MTDGSDEGTELFPLFLDLAGRSCLLVGDGPETAAKGAALRRAGAVVTLLAEAWPAAWGLPGAGVRWLREPWRPELLAGMWLVVSASPDAELNARIAAAAAERRIFFNAVDMPRFCSAQWPSVVRRPPVTVALSTRGASPALAAHLRRRIAGLLPENLGELAHWLGEWRQRAAPRLGDLANRGRFWRQLLDGGVAERFLAGDRDGAEAMVREALARVSSPPPDAG